MKASTRLVKTFEALFRHSRCTRHRRDQKHHGHGWCKGNQKQDLGSTHFRRRRISTGSWSNEEAVAGVGKPLVIRTDFSDQATWEAIMKAIKTTSPDGFDAYVEFLDDPAFQGLTSTQLLDLVSEYKSQHLFLMIVDELTITNSEHPLVVVNLLDDKADDDDDTDEPVDEPQYGRQFRAVPAAIQSIENNLTVGNLLFEEFADAVDEDGVFRDFVDPAE